MSKHMCNEGEYSVSLFVQQLPEGAWLATSKDLPGLVAQGPTRHETIEAAREVARQLIASYCDHGDPLPHSVKKPPTRSKVEIALSLP